jgi:20S proteasome alpha/beta subunit
VLKVDAAGHFLPYKAVAAGKSEQEAMNFMEKKVAEMPTLDEEECVEMAISTMQYVMSTDFKGTVLCCAVLSCAVLYCDILWYDVLRCAVVCCLALTL